MHKPRIIPVLLIKENKLVKSTRFENLKYIGDPINAAKIFNEKKLDEIIVIDIDATKNKKVPNLELIKKLSDECYMPFSYGGGINNVNFANEIIQLGAEKVIINNCILKKEKIVTELSENFGKQAVVVSIDIIKDQKFNYRVFDYLSKKLIEVDLEKHIKKIESLGAGEIFLNFVEKDGTMEGYDINAINTISSYVSIPLMVCGGAGKILDFKNLVEKAPNVSGMCAGSFFLYQGKMKSVLINAPSENERKKIYDL